MTTQSPPASGHQPSELAMIIGVPAAWGILLLFHPTGDTEDFYPVIDGNVTAWLTVHLGMGIFVPLFAAVVYLLLRGVESTAATVSRIGLAVIAVAVRGLGAPARESGRASSRKRSTSCPRHSRQPEGTSSSRTRRAASSPLSRFSEASVWLSG